MSTGFINTRVGRYEIRERIGTGGMARVFKAWDTNLDRAVAIKILHEHLADDPTFKERFKREAKFIASFFFVPVVFGLNWRRGTREGAIWSMATGFLACLAWTFTLQHSFSRHGIDSVEVGVVTSAVTFVLVSRLTPPTPEKNLAIFFDRDEA